MVNRIEHSVCYRRVVGSSPIRGVLFSILLDFECIRNNCSQSKMGAVARARLAFRVLAFANKNILVPSLCIDNLLSVGAKK